MNSTDLSTNQAPRAPGVSGRKITLIVLSGMVIVGCGITYFFAAYDRFNVQRSKSQEIWRELANSLDKQYKDLESQYSARLPEDNAWLKEFKQQVEQFRTATNIESQTAMAARLEEHLSAESQKLADANLVRDHEAKPFDAQLQDQVAQYNRSVNGEMELLQKWSGRFVQSILPAPVLPQLKLH